MNWSIGKKILLGYLVALSLLITIGLGSFFGVRDMLEAERLQAHTSEVLDQVDELELNVVSAESAHRGYLLLGREEYLPPYSAAITRLPVIREQLRRLISGDTAQQGRFIRLESAIADKLKLMAELVSLRHDQGNNEASLALFATGKGRDLMLQVTALVGEMRSAELSLLKDRSERAEQSA